MAGIRVMLVDEHEVVREGLKMVLELDPEIQVVCDAPGGVQALRIAPQARPDVVLMDLLMPGMDGVEACREMKSLLPGTRVIMLTSSADERAVESSIVAGASGYVLKNVGRQELVRCIKAVARGGSLLDPEVASSVMERMRRLIEKERAQEKSSLSGREREVLALVAQGYTNKEIAESLIISEHTARNHVIRILDKLGLSRRSEAAAYAARHGLAPEQSHGSHGMG